MTHLPETNYTPSSPLATTEQNIAEKQVLRIIASPEVNAARSVALQILASHPIAVQADGNARLEYALDKWIAQLALQDVGRDLSKPRFLWTTTLSDYQWFGHHFPGSGAAIDCPDNIYRNAAINGSSTYEVHGQLHSKHPAQFSYHLTNHPEANGFDISDDSMSDIGGYGMLTNDTLKISADGSFVITLDSQPANNRPNHIQMPKGKALYLLARDTLSNWAQVPNQLSIKHTGGAALPEAWADQMLAQRTATNLPHFIKFWLRFNDSFHNHPALNTLVAPYGRTGTLGYASAGRFALTNNEALVITVADGNADYAGMQVTDPWMIGFSPTEYLSSYNQSQTTANPDGTRTYIIAPQDPGTKNWVDTGGLNQGWILFRWQGVPPELTNGDHLIQSIKRMNISKLAQILPAALQGLTTTQRQQELSNRKTNWQLRMNSHLYL